MRHELPDITQSLLTAGEAPQGTPHEVDLAQAELYYDSCARELRLNEPVKVFVDISAECAEKGDVLLMIEFCFVHADRIEIERLRVIE